MRHSLLFLALSLTACTSTSSEPPDFAAEQAKLDTATQTFALSTPSSYRYTYQLNCGNCQATVRQPQSVTVANDAVVGAVYLTTDELVPAEVLTHTPTVHALFDRIQNYIDSGAHRIDVEYDATYGYPSWAFIDPSEHAVDDENGWSATDLDVRVGDPW